MMEIPVTLIYWNVWPAEAHIGDFTGVNEGAIEDIMRCVSKALALRTNEVTLYKGTIERYILEREVDTLSEKPQPASFGKSHYIELRLMKRFPSAKDIYGTVKCLKNCEGFSQNPTEFPIV